MPNQFSAQNGQARQTQVHPGIWLPEQLWSPARLHLGLQEELCSPLSLLSVRRAGGETRAGTMSLGPGQGAEPRAGWPHALGWGFRSWCSLCQSTLLPVPTAGCPPETRAKRCLMGAFQNSRPQAPFSLLNLAVTSHYGALTFRVPHHLYV